MEKGKNSCDRLQRSKAAEPFEARSEPLTAMGRFKGVPVYQFFALRPWHGLAEQRALDFPETCYLSLLSYSFVSTPSAGVAH
ncbi:hypothetical protein [Rhizobium yanglingense]